MLIFLMRSILALWFFKLIYSICGPLSHKEVPSIGQPLYKKSTIRRTMEA